MGESGGVAVMTGTNGGDTGPNRVVARYELRALLAIAALGLVNNLVNVSTILADRASTGLQTTPWHIWLDEMSSWFGMICMLPLIRRAASAFRPPRLPWPAVPLAHLPAAMLFSGGHVAVMVALRQLGWSSMGGRYDFFGARPNGVLIYEFRKDILFYTAATIVLLLVRSLAESRASHSAEASPERIEVRDGSRTLWLDPVEIVSVEAAGNYVELRTAESLVLHRATLAGMEALLGSRFARIHRSRLVRRDAVREFRSAPSGDFELVLSDGRVIGGSRRFRDRLQL